MKGYSNLKFTKKAGALFMACFMSISLSSCAGYADLSSVTATDLVAMDEVKDVTLIDELINAGKLKTQKDINIIQSADKLSRYMDIVDALKNENFEGVSELQPLSSEQYNEVLSYSLDEINRLKSEAHYKGNDIVSLEKKVNAIKLLDYLNNYCKEWIHNNGQDISIGFMMTAVKGAVGSELNIPVEDYGSITIEKQSTTNFPDSNYISVGDKRYEVRTNDEELWNTINYIYAVQNFDPENGKEIATYRKAINYGKITMAAGANVKDNRFENQYSASYIKKNYVK